MSKLYIDHQTDNRIILAVDHGGKHWEIDVTIDPNDDDYGINVDVGRDSVLCTSCAFGWNEKHENEPQDDDRDECGCTHHADFIGHDSAEG
jgi:hypothetical protein